MKHWTLYVQRKFPASHALPHHTGKCQQVHGHTWTIEVEIRYTGEIPSEACGMIEDFGEIKRVIDQLDHIHLNTVIYNPTAENIAEFLRNGIRAQMYGFLADAGLLVRVWESDDTYVELS